MTEAGGDQGAGGWFPPVSVYPFPIVRYQVTITQQALQSLSPDAHRRLMEQYGGVRSTVNNMLTDSVTITYNNLRTVPNVNWERWMPIISNTTSFVGMSYTTATTTTTSTNTASVGALVPSLYFAAGTELGPETSEERQRLYLDMMAERRIAIMESVQRRLEEQQARERDALEAEARAKELLYLALSPDQQKSIEERGHFVFKSQHGNHYRILTNQGTEGNIKQLSAEDGYVVQGWCAATKIDGRDRMIPKWDTFLGQMLDLQANEDAFMRIANRY